MLHMPKFSTSSIIGMIVSHKISISENSHATPDARAFNAFCNCLNNFICVLNLSETKRLFAKCRERGLVFSCAAATSNFCAVVACFAMSSFTALFLSLSLPPPARREPFLSQLEEIRLPAREGREAKAQLVVETFQEGHFAKH